MRFYRRKTEDGTKPLKKQVFKPQFWQVTVQISGQGTVLCLDDPHRRAVACCRHNPMPSLCRQEERLLRLRIFDAALRMTRFGVVTSNHRAFSVLLSDQREPKDPYSVTAQPILRRFYRRISFNTVGRGACPPPPIRFHVHTADTPAIQPLRHGGTQGPALHSPPRQRPFS